MTEEPTIVAKYPSDTISLPDGRVMCANTQCFGRKIWNVLAGEFPECIMCSAAWHRIEERKHSKP